MKAWWMYAWRIQPNIYIYIFAYQQFLQFFLIHDDEPDQSGWGRLCDYATMRLCDYRDYRDYRDYPTIRPSRLSDHRDYPFLERVMGRELLWLNFRRAAGSGQRTVMNLMAYNPSNSCFRSTHQSHKSRLRLRLEDKSDNTARERETTQRETTQR